MPRFLLRRCGASCADAEPDCRRRLLLVFLLAAGCRPLYAVDVGVGAGTEEWKVRCRKAGVKEDATIEKLLFAEHGTKLPEGHEVTVTKDDLPEEDEDGEQTAGDMGDFAASIGGKDDY